MKYVLIGIAATAILLVIFWYGGVDYDERGVEQAYSLFVAIVIGVAIGAAVQANSK